MPGRGTVFIVDDHAAVRGVLAALVAELDLNVECYASAEEFLEGYDRNKPGCLILDVQMPGMDGIELLELLETRGDHIPTILMSGEPDHQIAARAMESGAVGFIQKPFQVDFVLDRIRHFVDEDVEARQTHSPAGWRG